MDRLDTLAVFVAVGEHASFAEAARRLNRTPASVTRAVADLKAHLKTRLLNRTTRAVSLTEAGTRHLELARRLLGAYAEMRDLDSESRADPSGVLNVTAPANFGRLHVVPLVAEFLNRHPTMDVRMLLVDRVVSLIEEGLDVGVRLGHLPDSSLRAVRVGRVALGVYASPNYLARCGAPLTPHDLRDRPVVSSTAVSPVPNRWTLEGEGGAETVPVLPRLVVNTTDAAAEAAAAGIGLTLLISYQVAHHLADGRLVEVLTGYARPPIPIHLVQPAGRFPPAKVRLLIDEIGRALRARFASGSRLSYSMKHCGFDGAQTLRALQ